jgi:hypothetical protein
MPQKKTMQLAWNEFFEVEVRPRIDARFRVTEYELDAILGTEKAIGIDLFYILFI